MHCCAWFSRNKKCAHLLASGHELSIKCNPTLGKILKETVYLFLHKHKRYRRIHTRLLNIGSLRRIKREKLLTSSLFIYYMLFNIFKVLLHSSLKVVKIIMQVFLKLVQLNFMKMRGEIQAPSHYSKTGSWGKKKGKR